MFLLWFDDLPLVTLLFIYSKHFEFFHAWSDEVGQNIETTITSFKIARYTRTVLCRPVIRSEKESLKFPGVLSRMM